MERVMATFETIEEEQPEEQYVLTAVDRRVFFREKLFERIREQIGTNNPDQEIREQILFDICAKITAVYVGCFSIIEESLGKDVWAYKVPSKEYYSMSREDQERCKIQAMIWDECKNQMKQLGNDISEGIIRILSRVTFTQKQGMDILAQAEIREKRKIEEIERNEQYERSKKDRRDRK